MTINAKATTYTYGTSGNDIINAQYLLGDLIDGLAGNDTITGLDGGDVLVGNNGHDIIHGLGGHDVLDGGAGRDQLFGGLGNDLFRPDTGAIGNDFMDGGSDLDTIDYGNSAAVCESISIKHRLRIPWALESIPFVMWKLFLERISTIQFVVPAGMSNSGVTMAATY